MNEFNRLIVAYIEDAIGSIAAGWGRVAAIPVGIFSGDLLGGSINSFNNVINVVDDKMLIFDPKEDSDDFFYHGKKQGRRDLNKRENKDKKFAFDAVFPPGSTNQQVFEGTTKDLVETVFAGYNCSVFAYGATGAGKTFTMLGSKV